MMPSATTLFLHPIFMMVPAIPLILMMNSIPSKKKDKSVPSEDTKQVILASVTIKPYTRHKDEVLNDFLTCLSLAPKKIWANLLAEREVLLLNGEKVLFPHIIAMLSGFKTAQKLAIANLALIDWNGVMKKRRISGPNSKFPWYQTITQNQCNCAFLGLMNTSLANDTGRFQW